MKKVDENKKSINIKGIRNNPKLAGVIEFIKTHILKKTKVLSIIGVILFVTIVAAFYSSSLDITGTFEISEKMSLIEVLKDRLLTLVLIIFAGWVAYFYIPAIAYVAYVVMNASNLVIAMQSNSKVPTLLLNLLPVILDILTVSIIAAIGIYMCGYSTRKHRYNQKSSFSFLDMKIQLANMKKDKSDYEKLVEKKEKRIEKVERDNVKIDYSNILKIAPIVIVINLALCLIQFFINN